jgi:hypothetical protein
MAFSEDLLVSLEFLELELRRDDEFVGCCELCLKVSLTKPIIAWSISHSAEIVELDKRDGPASD